MPRALWKGAISFGLVHIPVEMFGAEKRDELDLDLIDKRDFAPVGYKRYNKHTGKDVDWDNIVKGYEYEENEYVVLTDQELKQANPAATQSVDLLAFVPLADIDPLYYEQPYYLAPVRRAGKVYALLRETLQRTGLVGIGQVVIRTRQHLAALRVMGDALILHTLRYAHEIREVDDVPVPDEDAKAAGVSDAELKMATALVQSMTQPWQPAQYKDSYRDDIMALIDRKIAAQETHVVRAVEEDEATAHTGSNVIDLMALLKKSLGATSDKADKPAGKRKAPTKAKAATSHKPRATTSKRRQSSASA